MHFDWLAFFETALQLSLGLPVAYLAIRLTRWRSYHLKRKLSPLRFLFATVLIMTVFGPLLLALTDELINLEEPILKRIRYDDWYPAFAGWMFVVLVAAMIWCFTHSLYRRFMRNTSSASP